jgi:radical SAM protein with 4Fe4S-binding SPASM domain
VSQAISRRAVLHATTPDLRQQRGEAWLLVWGGLGQWLVVDGDARVFIDRFDGRQELRQILRRHAKAVRRPLAAVEAEAMPLIEDLLERGILRRQAEAPAPGEEPVSIANLTINITNRCNLRCTHCYNRGHSSPDAPIEDIVAGIRGGRGILDPDASLVVLGGEPLLDPARLFALLDGCDGLFGQRPVISTNGTLITPALARQLAARRVEVQVSLDHHLAPRHDTIRGQGSWDEALLGIRRLVEAGAYTILCRVYQRGDEAALEPYLDMAEQLGVQELRFIPLRGVGAGAAEPERLPDQLAVLRGLLAILQRRPALASLLARDWFSIAATLLGRGRGRSSCGIGRRVLLVDADGLVYPCPNHCAPAFAAGSLLEQPMDEIVRDSEVFAAMRSRYHVARYHRCKGCPFRAWCAGDCRGEVLALTGEAHGPSPHCAELRAVYTELLWLTAAGRLPIGERGTLPDGRPIPRTFQ